MTVVERDVMEQDGRESVSAHDAFDGQVVGVLANALAQAAEFICV